LFKDNRVWVRVAQQRAGMINLIRKKYQTLLTNVSNMSNGKNIECKRALMVIAAQCMWHCE